MISISLIEASKNSSKGEDGNVFLFFYENAVEELHGSIPVSRIARVCKVATVNSSDKENIKAMFVCSKCLCNVAQMLQLFMGLVLERLGGQKDTTAKVDFFPESQTELSIWRCWLTIFGQGCFSPLRREWLEEQRLLRHIHLQLVSYVNLYYSIIILHVQYW